MALPDYQEILRLMTAYDLLGFQTERDAKAFLAAIGHETELVTVESGVYQAYGNTFHVHDYPIGIDPDSIRNSLRGLCHRKCRLFAKS